MKPQAELTERRSAQAQDDYPKQDNDVWLKHTLTFHCDGDVEYACRPVHLDTLSDAVSSIPLRERVY